MNSCADADYDMTAERKEKREEAKGLQLLLQNHVSSAWRFRKGAFSELQHFLYSSHSDGPFLLAVPRFLEGATILYTPLFFTILCCLVVVVAT